MHYFDQIVIDLINKQAGAFARIFTQQTFNLNLTFRVKIRFTQNNQVINNNKKKRQLACDAFVTP